MTSTLPKTCPHCETDISATAVVWRYGSVPVCKACGTVLPLVTR